MIRRIKRGEFEQVFKLFSDAFQREIEITGLDASRLRRMARFYSLISGSLFLLDILHIDFETILVAALGKRVVGGIHLVPHGKKIWSLDSAAVDKHFRGRGIYRNLMNEALKYIVTRHGEKIVTSIWTSNVAPAKVTNELKYEVWAEKVLMQLRIVETFPEEAGNEISIRTVKPSDIQPIYEIHKVLDPKKIEVHKLVPGEFLESFSNRLRNRIARVNSKRWVLVARDKIVGYACVNYTCPKEAANIESFYVLPLKNYSVLVSAFLRHLVNFIRKKNIRKVIARLNKDWLEIIEAFRCLGFEDLAFEYEMVKELVDGEQYEY